MKAIASIKKSNMLINRNFALLWLGQAISYGGDFVFDTTLILWITTVLAKGQSWLSLAVSGVALAATLPSLIVGPISGVFVDRWDKRLTMMAMDALRAVLIALLLLATGIVPLPFVVGGHTSIFWQLVAIYVAVVLESVCSQFFTPSRLALIGDIVPEPQRSQAIGLSHATFNLALILGPSLAAPLFFAFGAKWAILIDALSFGASFLAILVIHAPKSAVSGTPGQRRNFFREFAEGLRFFQGNTILIMLLVAGVIFNLGTGASNALYLVFVLRNLHTPTSLAGLFPAAYGVAVIVGSIGAAIFARRIGEGRLFWLSFLAWGVFMLAFARMNSFVPALIVFFLQGLANAGINVVVGPLKLRVTPREFIGRSSAVFNPIILAAGMLSAALAGFLGTALAGLRVPAFGMTFGALNIIFTGVGLLAVSAGVYVIVTLRHVDLDEAEQSDLDHYVQILSK